MTIRDYPPLADLTQQQITNVLSLDYARYVKCCVAAGGMHSGFALWRERHPRSLTLTAKAAVNPGSVVEPAWAQPLAVLAPAQNAVIGRVRARAILGRLDGLRSVPFATAGAYQTSGTTYAWVGEGAPKPVGNLQFTAASVGIAKASGIVVISGELARLGSESDSIIRDDIERGLVEYLDSQLMDHTVAAAADRPGSILNTAPSVGSSGTSGPNALTDVKALMRQFFANNADARAPYWIMSVANAASIAAALNVQNLDRLFNIAVLTSTAAGNHVALVDAGSLLLADGRDLAIDISKQASLEMNTTAASPVTGSTQMVSLWQNDLIGLRAQQTINWRLLPPSAASYTVQAYA